MKAVVPLNVTGLRVSNADATDVTPRSGFAGRTATFDQLPHGKGSVPSTGDQVWRSLRQPAAEALTTGIHLHWQLPDFFTRGHQDPSTGQIHFPTTPTRWLVTRTLRVFDPTASAYGAPQATSWVVESDYVSATITPDRYGVTRLPVAVPLTAPNGAPSMFMGRVVEGAAWQPASESAVDYLPHYLGADQQPLRLTSIGFAGPAFSGYYPDCRSVFGFWDSFADVPSVFTPINANTPIQLAASYAVVGWLPTSEDDPLTGLAGLVTDGWNHYVAQCAAEKVERTRQPVDVFHQLTTDHYGWTFSHAALGFTQAADGTISDVTVPSGTLCAGIVQDLVWDGGSAPFLAAPQKARVWTDQVEVTAGNTTAEAVAALVAADLPAPAGGSAVLADYEVLLEALQLGVLRELEGQGNALVTLSRARHDLGFSSVDGGHLWTVQTAAAPSRPSSVAITLPLTLAEQLDVLNRAQRAYDQARDKLTTIRQQLFMDWITYVQGFVQTSGSHVVPTNALIGFLTNADSGEIATVTAEALATGLIDYTLDPDTGHVVDVTTSDAATTLAGRLVTAQRAVAAALAALAADGPQWQLDAIPAPPFWLATDPVLVVEGKRIEPPRRNGTGGTVAVRTDAELVSRLTVAVGHDDWTVDASALPGLAALPSALPDGVAAVVAESTLLDPQRSLSVAQATGAADPANVAGVVAAAVGGQSPLDTPVSPGLFGAVRTAGYPGTADPVQTVTAPAAGSVTFTNPAGTAYAPDPVGWTTQVSLPEFSASRHDPFLPVWLVWSGQLDPLDPSGTGGGDYTPTTLSERFALDAHHGDFTYPVPAAFTTGGLVDYQGEVVLSKTAMVSITAQIDGYLTEFADDPADPELVAARQDLADRRVMSQALDTFSLAQTLRQTIPQIPVVDLVKRPDVATTQLDAAANAVPGDSWYDTGFNALAPVSVGQQALGNFGPLRAGFLEIFSLNLVDVFGQRLQLQTSTQTPSGALTLRPAATLRPEAGDTANAAKLYLPPRLLTPSRIEAHWLSASHNDEVVGMTNDFWETSDHPATSPVCGWVLPNHLDVSLVCYDADGSAVGSFDLAGGRLVYTTRPGNLANPRSDLALDVGPAPVVGVQPSRPVNPHLAELMWFIHGRDAAFLQGLLATIEKSTGFIGPAKAAQDVSLSVLIGRPLAIVRAALGLSTAGGTLPVSQANTSAGSALGQTVTNAWTSYADRQAHTAAGLDQLDLALALGDLSDLDDGLVAYLPEAGRPQRYSTVYSPAAVGTEIKVPPADALTFTLNAAVQTLTVLVDPRAPVHISSGVLPTTSLLIPPDQYALAMQRLAVIFTTRPVLGDQLGLRLPLPTEPGYRWSWVAFGDAPVLLDAAPQPGTPVYGHGPQTLQEGWLQLQPDPAGSGASA